MPLIIKQVTTLCRLAGSRLQAGLGRWAEREREREREATHVAVPGGADPTNGTNSDRPAPTSEGTNAAAACVPVPVPSTVAGRGSGWADVHSQEFTSSSSSWGKPHQHWTEPMGFPVTFSPVLRLPGGAWAEKINILGVK